MFANSVRSPRCISSSLMDLSIFRFLRWFWSWSFLNELVFDVWGDLHLGCKTIAADAFSHSYPRSGLGTQSHTVSHFGSGSQRLQSVFFPVDTYPLDIHRCNKIAAQYLPDRINSKRSGIELQGTVSASGRRSVVSAWHQGGCILILMSSSYTI